MHKIGIVNLNMGNLLSVKRAVESCGKHVEYTNAPHQITTFDKLILPGVGAFTKGMSELQRLQLIPAIHQFIRTGKPLLGICLGMQLLFERGEEFGNTPGLGLIKGTVKKIPTHNAQHHSHKIPHIGWNAIYSLDNNLWHTTLFHTLPEKPFMYFVHSYAAHPASSKNIIAYTNYNEIELCAAVQHNNVLGCQFHPEKSGADGLKIIENFLRM